MEVGAGVDIDGGMCGGMGGVGAGSPADDARGRSGPGTTGSISYPSKSSPLLSSASIAWCNRASKSKQASAAAANTATGVCQGENSAPERVCSKSDAFRARNLKNRTKAYLSKGRHGKIYWGINQKLAKCEKPNNQVLH